MARGLFLRAFCRLSIFNYGLYKRLLDYLDNVTLNEWSAGPSETVLLYVPGGGSLILNDGGEELYRAIFRVACGKAPNAQRLFGGCSHGTLPREAPGREPR
jgi:hypothetical protein